MLADVWDVRLEHLNLRNNCIAGELPEDVEKLTHSLQVSCPHGTSNRGCATACADHRRTFWQELYLDENELMHLPECLKDFTALTRLTVSSNSLKRLPPLPPQLLELQAKDNDLKWLPKCLCVHAVTLCNALGMS
eukprot:SAG11_NODE_12882_length_681_cov_1.039519_2_plen_135_part_00